MITSGTVSFEDGKKASEEYTPAKKAKVELRFDIPEGEQDVGVVIDGIIELARRKVAEMLGGTVKPTYAVNLEKPIDSVTVAGSIEPDKPKRGRPPKAASPAADPTAMEDAPVEDLSDRAITVTTVAVYSKLNKSAKVKELIKKFCPDDGVHPSLKRIPGDKRSEYLKVLNTLTE